MSKKFLLFNPHDSESDQTITTPKTSSISRSVKTSRLISHISDHVEGRLTDAVDEAIRDSIEEIVDLTFNPAVLSFRLPQVLELLNSIDNLDSLDVFTLRADLRSRLDALRRHNEPGH